MTYNGNKHSTIITESPTTASAISKSTNVATMATFGHLFDFDYQKNKLCLVAKNPALIDRLKYLNTPKDNVIIATDNDPQGDLIAEHVKALTPHATHSRIHVNSLASHDIQLAIQTPVESNHSQAMQGAYLRVLNLKLAAQSKGALLTTTSITLAKSISERGRLNNLMNYTIEVAGKTLHTRLPSQHVDSLQVRNVPPTNTRHLTTLAAYDNMTNAQQQMQTLYENKRLSYVRTESHHLPQSNLVYKNHTSQYGSADAHLAIHNLTLAHSTIESQVYKINESATGCERLAVEIDTRIGKFIALDDTFRNEPLTPTAELMLHLSLESDAYVSTIGKASHRYTREFYKGSELDGERVSRVLSQAALCAPTIVDLGIKKAVDIDNPFVGNHAMDTTRAFEKVNFRKTNIVEFEPSSDFSHAL